MREFLWAVVWKKEVIEEYELKKQEIVAFVGDDPPLEGRAIFRTKKEATLYCKTSNDWIVVPCRVSYGRRMKKGA